MYYQFDSRMSLPAISFDDDRIVVSGNEYYYTDLKDIAITKAPLFSTYGIMELTTQEKSIPVPFAKGDLHRLRTAVQEAKHILQTNALRKQEAEIISAQLQSREIVESSAQLQAGKVTVQPQDKEPETITVQTPVKDPAEADGIPATAKTPQTVAAFDPYEEMKKLKELLDLDIITPEEFARKKKELLGL